MTALERTLKVLDTCMVILLPRLCDTALLPTKPLITAVTLRVVCWPGRGPQQSRASASSGASQQADTDFDPMPFDAAAARLWHLLGKLPTDEEKASSSKSAA